MIPRPAAWRFACLTASLVAAGCNGDDDREARVATYNVGLAFGYVPEASARVDPIISAIEASELDLVCLQELWVNQNEAGEWTTEVIDRVLSGVSDVYPHHYWVRTEVPEDAPETGCTLEESDRLLACVEPACGAEHPDNLADCVLLNCGEEFASISASCQQCLVTNLSQPLDAIVAACRGIMKGGIVYDGHNGLAIVSKHPLEGTEVLELDYALTARSVLHARVDLPAIGPTDVYCTHLAADLSNSIAYPGGGTFGSFGEENEAQTRALLDWVEQTSTTSNVLMFGDFNHGPGVGGTPPELPDSYALVTDAGYADPVAELDPRRCTFCDGNLLVSGSGDGGQVIDHVYLRLATGSAEKTEIVFDDTLEVTGADGQPKTVNLSDHYGVAVTLDD